MIIDAPSAQAALIHPAIAHLRLARFCCPPAAFMLHMVRLILRHAVTHGIAIKSGMTVGFAPGLQWFRREACGTINFINFTLGEVLHCQLWRAVRSSVPQPKGC